VKVKHAGYEVASVSVWCFCTEYNIVTVVSEVIIWLGGFWRQCM